MVRLAWWILGWALQVSETPPAPATWRFRDAEKPVKVVVLAGSIGAFSKSYAGVLQDMCSEIEVRNLSKTGFGAWPLKQHFKQQVLENRNVDLGDPRYEYWLVYGGGINSIGNPEATNHHIRNTFMLAHKAGMKVVGLTITPWGDERDARFRGLEGLKYRRASQLVVDFVMGRLSPARALGSYVAKRPGKDGSWTPAELAEIAVDLYDSPLRDRDAATRDPAATRKLVAGDGAWRKRHAGLSDAEREAALASDAALLTELPRWYLRPELRSFDHVHPNAEGHRHIAATVCPKLPEHWGCRCESELRSAR